MCDADPLHIKQIRGTLFNFREQKWTDSIQFTNGCIDKMPQNQLIPDLANSKYTDKVHYRSNTDFDLEYAFKQKYPQVDHKQFTLKFRIVTPNNYKQGLELYYAQLEAERRKQESSAYRKKYRKTIMKDRFSKNFLQMVFAKKEEFDY